MKREIKFRGLSYHHEEGKAREFEYGYLSEETFGISAFESTTELVINEVIISPESVGQLIMNSASEEIYEGDIVADSLFWDIKKTDLVHFTVAFINNGFKMVDKKGGVFEITATAKVIGNIHELN